MINKDFYPTPHSLIKKMWSKVDTQNIKTVLEPSAGKGDICDFLKDKKLDIDCIEIEPDLRALLKGKGYKVVFDDFLLFQGNKKYDLLLANFPFGDGELHLRKAIDVLSKYGGQLVCLVNAETIKNRFSSSREALYGVLQDNGADIEYLSNEFENAERKTAVEVALVSVHLNPAYQNSLILDSLTKTKVNTEFRESSEIVSGDFLQGLVQRFDQECSLGLELIKEYAFLENIMVKKISKNKEDERFNDTIIKLNIDGANEYNNDYINKYLQKVRYKYWDFLVNDERFTSKLTSNLRNNLWEKLNDLSDYDFNKYNILTVQEELNRNINQGVEDSILKLFDELSYKFAYSKEFGNNIHYFNGWKSNKAHKINRKVIIPMNGFSSWGSKDRLEYYVRDRLLDMVKVFNYLVSEVSDVPALVGSKIEEANTNSDFKNMNFHYFDVTFYRKGTCHIVFRDENLLKKFNIYGSQKRGWLPPNYGMPYEDMSDEEKVVIDEFQGVEDYKKTIERRDYFLEIESSLLLESG